MAFNLDDYEPVEVRLVQVLGGAIQMGLFETQRSYAPGSIERSLYVFMARLL